MAALQPVIQGQQESEPEPSTPAEVQVTADLTQHVCCSCCQVLCTLCICCCVPEGRNLISSATAQGAWQVEEAG